MFVTLHFANAKKMKQKNMRAVLLYNFFNPGKMFSLRMNFGEKYRTLDVLDPRGISKACT